MEHFYHFLPVLLRTSRVALETHAREDGEARDGGGGEGAGVLL